MEGALRVAGLLVLEGAGAGVAGEFGGMRAVVVGAVSSGGDTGAASAAATARGEPLRRLTNTRWIDAKGDGIPTSRRRPLNSHPPNNLTRSNPPKHQHHHRPPKCPAPLLLFLALLGTTSPASPTPTSAAPSPGPPNCRHPMTRSPTVSVLKTRRDVGMNPAPSNGGPHPEIAAQIDGDGLGEEDGGDNGAGYPCGVYRAILRRCLAWPTPLILKRWGSVTRFYCRCV